LFKPPTAVEIICISLRFCSQIGWKQLTQLRQDREQAIIEEISGRALNRNDPCKTRAYKRDLIVG
jgi:hypothetical protein